MRDVHGPEAQRVGEKASVCVADVRGIADLLRSDPELSAELLAVANSSFYRTPHYIDNLPLIHDVGRLGLLRAYGERYAPVYATRHNTVADCLDSERRLFEMDHCQAGLLLTGFPSEYSRVAGCHYGEMPVARQDLASRA